MSTSGFTPICPRCGYDQSGIVDTWTDSCPTEGVCTECGLGFEWATVFEPARFDLPWYVEHGRGVRAWIVRSMKTILRLLSPVHFCRELDMTRRVAPLKLVVWAVSFIALIHVISSIPIGIRSTFANMPGFSGRPIQIHTARSFVAQYGLDGVGVIVFNGIAYPFGSIAPYFQPFSPRLAYAWETLLYRRYCRPFAFSVGFTLFWLVILVVLPNTREVSKVRIGHLLRAGVLSIVMICIAIECHRLSTTFLYARNSYQFVAMETFRTLIVYGLVVWQLVYWPSVIIVGWRIEERRLLLTLGTVAAILGGLTTWTLLYLAFGDAAFR